MCLTDTYSRVQVRENLSDTFPIRNGLKYRHALSPLLSNFALEYAIRRSQVIQGGLKFNDIPQLFVDADDVNVLGGGVFTIK